VKDSVGGWKSSKRKLLYVANYILDTSYKQMEIPQTQAHDTRTHCKRCRIGVREDIAHCLWQYPRLGQSLAINSITITIGLMLLGQKSFSTKEIGPFSRET
jgi:hypothetical protein